MKQNLTQNNGEPSISLPPSDSECPSTSVTIELCNSVSSLTDTLNTQINSNTQELINMIDALEKIEQAIPSSTISDGVVIAITGALSGAIAAFLFNWLYSSRTTKRDNLIKLASSLNEKIEVLESSARTYWLIPYSQKLALKLNAQEIKIKSNLKAVRILSRSFSSRINRTKNQTLVSEITDYTDNIYDLITGGEFESKDRKASINTATKISNSSSVIRAKISDFSFIN
jgi:hypothetical protein